MKIAACHVPRELSTTALLAISKFAICAPSSRHGDEETSGWQSGKRVIVRKPAGPNDRFYYILGSTSVRHIRYEVRRLTRA